MRTIKQIAQEIKKTWTKPYFGAVPYLDAMLWIDSSDKHAPYLYEEAESILRYFLANATTWRGEDARRIKAEIKEILNS